MTEEQFRDRVTAAAGTHLEPEAVRVALDEFVGAGKVGNRFVAACVQRAGEVDAQLSKPAAGPTAVPVPDSALARYTGEQWVDAFEPRVRRCRSEIWQSEEPPWTLRRPKA